MFTYFLPIPCHTFTMKNFMKTFALLSILGANCVIAGNQGDDALNLFTQAYNALNPTKDPATCQVNVMDLATEKGILSTNKFEIIDSLMESIAPTKPTKNNEPIDYTKPVEKGSSFEKARLNITSRLIAEVGPAGGLLPQDKQAMSDLVERDRAIFEYKGKIWGASHRYAYINTNFHSKPSLEDHKTVMNTLSTYVKDSSTREKTPEVQATLKAIASFAQVAMHAGIVHEQNAQYGTMGALPSFLSLVALGGAGLGLGTLIPSTSNNEVLDYTKIGKDLNKAFAANNVTYQAMDNAYTQTIPGRGKVTESLTLSLKGAFEYLFSQCDNRSTTLLSNLKAGVDGGTNLTAFAEPSGGSCPMTTTSYLSPFSGVYAWDGSSKLIPPAQLSTLLAYEKCVRADLHSSSAFFPSSIRCTEAVGDSFYGKSTIMDTAINNLNSNLQDFITGAVVAMRARCDMAGANSALIEIQRLMMDLQNTIFSNTGQYAGATSQCNLLTAADFALPTNCDYFCLNSQTQTVKNEREFGITGAQCSSKSFLDNLCHTIEGANYTSVGHSFQSPNHFSPSNRHAKTLDFRTYSYLPFYNDIQNGKYLNASGCTAWSGLFAGELPGTTLDANGFVVPLSKGTIIPASFSFPEVNMSQLGYSSASETPISSMLGFGTGTNSSLLACGNTTDGVVFKLAWDSLGNVNVSSNITGTTNYTGMNKLISMSEFVANATETGRSVIGFYPVAKTNDTTTFAAECADVGSSSSIAASSVYGTTCYSQINNGYLASWLGLESLNQLNNGTLFNAWKIQKSIPASQAVTATFACEAASGTPITPYLANCILYNNFALACSGGIECETSKMLTEIANNYVAPTTLAPTTFAPTTFAPTPTPYPITNDTITFASTCADVGSYSSLASAASDTECFSQINDGILVSWLGLGSLSNLTNATLFGGWDNQKTLAPIQGISSTWTCAGTPGYLANCTLYNNFALNCSNGIQCETSKKLTAVANHYDIDPTTIAPTTPLPTTQKPRTVTKTIPLPQEYLPLYFDCSVNPVGTLNSTGTFNTFSSASCYLPLYADTISSISKGQYGNGMTNEDLPEIVYYLASKSLSTVDINAANAAQLAAAGSNPWSLICTANNIGMGGTVAYDGGTVPGLTNCSSSVLSNAWTASQCSNVYQNPSTGNTYTSAFSSCSSNWEKTTANAYKLAGDGFVTSKQITGTCYPAGNTGPKAPSSSCTMDLLASDMALILKAYGIDVPTFYGAIPSSMFNATFNAFSHLPLPLTFADDYVAATSSTLSTSTGFRTNAVSDLLDTIKAKATWTCSSSAYPTNPTSYSCSSLDSSFKFSSCSGTSSDSTHSYTAATCLPNFAVKDSSRCDWGTPVSYKALPLVYSCGYGAASGGTPAPTVYCKMPLMADAAKVINTNSFTGYSRKAAADLGSIFGTSWTSTIADNANVYENNGTQFSTTSSWWGLDCYNGTTLLPLNNDTECSGGFSSTLLLGLQGSASTATTKCWHTRTFKPASICDSSSADCLQMNCQALDKSSSLASTFNATGNKLVNFVTLDGTCGSYTTCHADFDLYSVYSKLGSDFTNYLTQYGVTSGFGSYFIPENQALKAKYDILNAVEPTTSIIARTFSILTPTSFSSLTKYTPNTGNLGIVPTVTWKCDTPTNPVYINCSSGTSCTGGLACTVDTSSASQKVSQVPLVYDCNSGAYECRTDFVNASLANLIVSSSHIKPFSPVLCSNAKANRGLTDAPIITYTAASTCASGTYPVFYDSSTTGATTDISALKHVLANTNIKTSGGAGTTMYVTNATYSGNGYQPSNFKFNSLTPGWSVLCAQATSSPSITRETNLVWKEMSNSIYSTLNSNCPSGYYPVYSDQGCSSSLTSYPAYCKTPTYTVPTSGTVSLSNIIPGDYLYVAAGAPVKSYSTGTSPVALPTYPTTTGTYKLCSDTTTNAGILATNMAWCTSCGNTCTGGTNQVYAESAPSLDNSGRLQDVSGTINAMLRPVTYSGTALTPATESTALIYIYNNAFSSSVTIDTFSAPGSDSAKLCAQTQFNKGILDVAAPIWSSYKASSGGLSSYGSMYYAANAIATSTSTIDKTVAGLATKYFYTTSAGITSSPSSTAYDLGLGVFVGNFTSTLNAPLYMCSTQTINIDLANALGTACTNPESHTSGAATCSVFASSDCVAAGGKFIYKDAGGTTGCQSSLTASGCTALPCGTTTSTNDYYYVAAGSTTAFGSIYSTHLQSVSPTNAEMLLYSNAISNTGVSNADLKWQAICGSNYPGTVMFTSAGCAKSLTDSACGAVSYTPSTTINGNIMLSWMGGTGMVTVSAPSIDGTAYGKPYYYYVNGAETAVPSYSSSYKLCASSETFSTATFAWQTADCSSTATPATYPVYSSASATCTSAITAMTYQSSATALPTHFCSSTTATGVSTSGLHIPSLFSSLYNPAAPKLCSSSAPINTANLSWVSADYNCAYPVFSSATETGCATAGAGCARVTYGTAPLGYYYFTSYGSTAQQFNPSSSPSNPLLAPASIKLCSSGMTNNVVTNGLIWSSTCPSSNPNQLYRDSGSCFNNYGTDETDNCKILSYDKTIDSTFGSNSTLYVAAAASGTTYSTATGKHNFAPIPVVCANTPSNRGIADSVFTYATNGTCADSGLLPIYYNTTSNTAYDGAKETTLPTNTPVTYAAMTASPAVITRGSDNSNSYLYVTPYDGTNDVTKGVHISTASTTFNPSAANVVPNLYLYTNATALPGTLRFASATAGCPGGTNKLYYGTSYSSCATSLTGTGCSVVTASDGLSASMTLDSTKFYFVAAETGVNGLSNQISGTPSASTDIVCSTARTNAADPITPSATFKWSTGDTAPAGFTKVYTGGTTTQISYSPYISAATLTAKSSDTGISMSVPSSILCADSTATTFKCELACPSNMYPVYTSSTIAGFNTTLQNLGCCAPLSTYLNVNGNLFTTTNSQNLTIGRLCFTNTDLSTSCYAGQCSLTVNKRELASGVRYFADSIMSLDPSKTVYLSGYIQNGTIGMNCLNSNLEAINGTTVCSTVSSSMGLSGCVNTLHTSTGSSVGSAFTCALNPAKSTAELYGQNGLFSPYQRDL